MQTDKDSRAYIFRLLDHRDHLMERKTELCLDDADANTRGKYRSGFRAVEVWQEDRFVGRWERGD